MKLKCQERVDPREWHAWFAWHPVSVAPRDCRWWEMVQRKGHEEVIGLIDAWAVSTAWVWEYRAVQ